MKYWNRLLIMAALSMFLVLLAACQQPDYSAISDPAWQQVEINGAVWVYDGQNSARIASETWHDGQDRWIRVQVNGFTICEAVHNREEPGWVLKDQDSPLHLRCEQVRDTLFVGPLAPANPPTPGPIEPLPEPPAAPIYPTV